MADPCAEMCARYWEVARAACPDLPSSLGNTDHETVLQAIRDARKVPDALRRAFHAERERTEMLRAEVEMLRGVGCLENGDGPCGACLMCARRERDALRAERDRLTGPEMRATMEGVLRTFLRLSVLPGAVRSLSPEDAPLIADAIMSLLRGEGR